MRTLISILLIAGVMAAPVDEAKKFKAKSLKKVKNLLSASEMITYAEQVAESFVYIENLDDFYFDEGELLNGSLPTIAITNGYIDRGRMYGVEWNTSLVIELYIDAESEYPNLEISEAPEMMIQGPYFDEEKGVIVQLTMVDNNWTDEQLRQTLKEIYILEAR